ncbi:MAG TPA: molybdate ABC transporter substrate-binding protein [Pyrinomonadaceae bacterium]|nr:molybdate ABC transporter substrate-binding protein [Pyrinomonadaceae bacterium]
MQFRLRSIGFFLRSLTCLLLAFSFGTIACQRQSAGPFDDPYEPEILVAAAANLSDSFPELAQEFTKQSGIKVVLSFGSTADLAKQVENGAPFDVFAAADVTHVSTLQQKGLITPGSVNRYARGSLVVWVPPGSKIKLERVEDLTNKSVERIVIAKPDIAPYGHAAVEALRALNLWQQIEPKVIYGMNVAQVRQFVSSGNAEVGFLPRSLVQDGQGTSLDIDEKLYQPIDQALGIVRASQKQESARRFTAFVLGPEGQTILQKHGYKSANGT